MEMDSTGVASPYVVVSLLMARGTESGLVGNVPSSSKKGQHGAQARHRSQKILFDPKARLEYLTGFERRNKLKKQDKLEKVKKMEQEYKREKRRQKRQKVAQALGEVVAELEAKEQTVDRIARVETYRDHGIVGSQDAQNQGTQTTVIIESLP